MYHGKSLVYCAFCRGFVFCQISLNKNSIIKSIGFNSLHACPRFLNTSVFMSKKLVEKSIPEINLMNWKKFSCMVSIWDSVKNAILNSK